MLQWPISAATFNTTQWGLGLWFKPVNLTSSGLIMLGGMNTTVTGSTSGHVIQFYQDAGMLKCGLYYSNTISRGLATPNVFTAGVWAFLTLEYYAPEASEALRSVLTVNGVVQTITFSGSGGSGALQNVGGNLIIGAQGTGGPSTPLPAGSAIGPNIYAFTSKMSAATEGLLTATARAALMGFEAPT
jgi:hypothetical protein